MKFWDRLFRKDLDKSEKTESSRRKIHQNQTSNPELGTKAQHLRALDFPYPQVATGEEWAPILFRNLTQSHGTIVEIKVPSFRPEIILSDGTVIIVDDYGIGYHGTGSYSFAAFLRAAGFDISKEEVANMKPPVSLKP